MQLTFDKREKIVGFFVISIIILLLTTIVFVGRGKNWFKKNITYYAIFDESYNLQEQAAVKLHNTDIGQVDDISIVNDKVRVKLKILEDYASRIRVDTIVTVESPTLIGSEFISVKTGRKDTELIPPEGTIKSQAKQSISDMLAQFELEKTAKLVSKTVENLYEITNELKKPKGSLFGAIDNLEKVIAGLEKGQGTLGSLLKSKELIESVQSKIEDIGKIVKNVEGATPETVKQLQISLKQIERILANIEKGSLDVPDITQKTKVTIDSIDGGLKNIDKVVKSVQKNRFIRGNIPKGPEGKEVDSELRN
ncbi:MAG: MCE family protein [Desulfobacterales bacterium]|nr:MCE family protein [Desulfobacterales bacterium]MCP4160412.1 MCE family protein [Deltaproteobacteria bacterium]